MTTAAKPRRKAVGGRRNGEKTLPPAAGLLETRDVLHGIEFVEAVDLDPTKRIEPSPYQPRMDFPAEEIRALAESLRRCGQLQPIVVRPKGKRYEIIDGERRWRAAVVAGMKTIRAEIQSHTDAQARAAVIESALRHRDLNPIERARALRQMLKAGDAAGPTELAELVGLSQGQVSNLLRLLNLPEAWQRQIISGEIPQSHARLLVPYAKKPAVLKQVKKELDKPWIRKTGKPESDHDNGPPSLEEFRECVSCAIDNVTKPMTEESWSSKLGKRIKPFKPSEAQREQLQIIDDLDGFSQRATNTKLWEKLQAEHEKALLKKQQDGSKKKGGRGKAEGGKVTAAERKRIEAQERERAKQRQRQFTEKLWRWKLDWSRYLIAKLLRSRDGVDVETLLRLLLYFSSAGTLQNAAEFARRGDVLAKLLAAAGVKARRRGYFHRPDLVPALGELQNRDVLHKLAGDYLAAIFWPADAAPALMLDLPAEDVAAIAAELGVDLAKAWKTEQAGKLSEAYWELHTKEQLVELCKELKVAIKTIGPASKATLIECLHKPGTVRRMPKEIVKIKRPK